MATAAAAAPTQSLYVQNNISRHSNPTSPPLSDPNYPYANRFGNNPAPTMSQTPPSANVSPTDQTSSPQQHRHVPPPRQLRQPRQPLYTPAALRPTDHKYNARPTDIPRPRAPDTPPGSKENSFDSHHSKQRKNSPPTLFELPGAATSIDARPSSLSSSETTINPSAPRRSLTSPSHSYSQSQSLDAPFASTTVTGPPTTAHWKPDVSATGCNICQQPFHWYMRRRHHCRRCGHVVCAADSAFQVPLDQHARFHIRGAPSRACNDCWDEWRDLNVRRANSIGQDAPRSEEEEAIEDEDDEEDDEVSERRRSNGKGVSIPASPGKKRAPWVGSLARSEGGMVWSTF